MTEEERQRLIVAKLDASERLTAEAAKIRSYQLWRVDERLEHYLLDVARNPDGHNLFEQLGVLRFLAMRRKYGLHAAPVKAFFSFYEQLHFPGKKGLQTYRLTPVQCFQFASIFGFWDEAGRRVTREACMYVPRKYSKTTSSASLVAWELIFGESNSESYTAANSADQAKKCFDVVRKAILKLDPTEYLYRVNEKMIKSESPYSTAMAQCLTANANTKDGLNASLVIMDEYSQARDSELFNVLTTSMGARENPLTVIITTASDVFDGPFYGMLDGYKSILLGDYEDDSVFCHLFMPDVDDDEAAESTWLKVQPHMGVTVSLDYYRREYRAAQRKGADAMLAFRTKLLNVYAENGRKSWISAGLIRTLFADLRLEKMRGRPDAMCAIDLSESDDFSAVSIGVYDANMKRFGYHTAYFFPEGALPGHPNEKLYRTWAEAGHLRLTPGDVIDYKVITEYVLTCNKYVRILAIGYDQWKSTEVVNILSAQGAKNVLKAVRQTYGNFTAPVEVFEHGAKTGRVVIDSNPITAYCFGNAVLDHDNLENCKPVKRGEYQKIDGVITILMCQRLFLDYER